MSSKKINLLYRIQKKLFTFLGDIKVFGWKHPLWFQINAHGYKLGGKYYYSVQKLIKPGDVFIRRYDGYFSSYVLPGFWTHCGMYIGDDQIVHSISEGVVQETLIDFMRTDYLLVLRADVKEENVKKAIELAKSIIGKPYDFGFDFKDINRFSCTELVAYCYPGLILGTKRFGKTRIIADDFANSSNFKLIWDSRAVSTTAE